MSLALRAAAVVSLLVLVAWEASAASVTLTRTRMGTSFEITVVHSSKLVAEKAAEIALDEIDRIGKMISSESGSETAAVNRAAGDRAVTVSSELFNLIRRSLKVSEVTEGAFDITAAPLAYLWSLDSANPKKPSQALIDAALADVGSANVVLRSEDRSVFLRRSGSRLGFEAVGIGFAVNQAVLVLKELGISGGMIRGGDVILTFGTRDDGSLWRIGVADPVDRKKVFVYLNVRDQAVVTTGFSQGTVLIDGKPYSRVIDPRTGYPVEELRGVTIVAPDSELADAIATAVIVVGLEEGLATVNRLLNVEGILFDMKGKAHVSTNLQKLMKQ